MGALSHLRGVNATISSLLVYYIVLAIFKYRVEGPLRDPASLNNFLNNNQDMHQAFAIALGIASYDLSEVAWDDPDDLSRWVLAHAQMHMAASQILGVS